MDEIIFYEVPEINPFTKEVELKEHFLRIRRM